MANLKNYTSMANPLKTAAEIEAILIINGAKSIQKDCFGGKVIALRFLVDTAIGEIPIALPVNVEAVQKILSAQKKRDSNVKATAEQAERTAWKCLKDWVEAQMALIQIGMVSMDQIFLPYVINRGGKTLYDTVREHGYLLDKGVERT